MSVITWILIVIMSLFLWVSVDGAAGDTGDSVPLAATPMTLIQPDTGPLTLETGLADRIGRTPPGATVAYAATSAALYRGEPDGTWIAVGDVPPAGDLVVADDPDILMTGEAEACARGGGGASLRISEDGGATWTPSTDERAIRPLAIWADDGFAIGAWCGGILLSHDLGRTWESPPNDPTLGFDVTAFAIVAGTEHQVLFSLTGEGGTSSVYHVDLNAADPWDGIEPVFTYWGLGGLAGSGQTFAIASITGVSVSQDAGATWETDRSGLENVTVPFDPAIEGFPEGFDPAGFGLRSILLDDKGSPLAVGGEQDVFVKGDAERWEHAIGYGEATRWLALSPDGAFILAQAETGAWLVRREE